MKRKEVKSFISIFLDIINTQYYVKFASKEDAISFVFASVVDVILQLGTTGFEI